MTDFGPERKRVGEGQERRKLGCGGRKPPQSAGRCWLLRQESSYADEAPSQSPEGVALSPMVFTRIGGFAVAGAAIDSAAMR